MNRKATDEKDSMIKIKETIQSIIGEIDDVNNQPIIPKLREEPVELPNFISTSDGNTLLLNKSISKKITELADYYFDQQIAIKIKYTRKEWRVAIRNMVGDCYKSTDPNDSLEQRGHLFKQQINSAKDENISRQDIYSLSFGCSLFVKPLNSNFTIGPVTFLPLKNWLDYASENRLIEEADHHSLIDFVSGNESTLDQELREQLHNPRVFDILNDSQILCTVKTEGLAPELARKRSLIAARLAQTSIALLWFQPSRILGGMHVTGEHWKKSRRLLLSTPNAYLGFHSELVRINYVDCEDITKISSYDKQLFDVAGQMIACWTSNADYSKASELLRGLSQALYFFWSGCNDDELMSIVKFVATMEALSPKQNSNAVLNLLKSRLNLKEEDPITQNQNLKEMVKLIYSQARSRTLHGTNTKLLHDWSIVQANAEVITRTCLVSSMNFLINNPTATELGCLSD